MGWLVLFYVLVALGCWVVFGRRFFFAKDIRRPKNADLFEAFPLPVEVLLFMTAITVMNPGRFVRAVGKSVLWPVTLWRFFTRAQGSVAAPVSAPSEGAPVEPTSLAAAPPRDESVPPAAPTARPSVEKRVGPAPTWGSPGPAWGAPAPPPRPVPGARGTAPPPPLPPRFPAPGRHSSF